jgi:EF-P beta-lysylation protein EpmB
MEEWKKIQSKNFHSLKSLADFLLLDEKNRSLLAWDRPFPLQLPIRLAEKIPKNSLDDPIARQFLPLKEESISHPNFTLNPNQEEPPIGCSKLLHKYKGRVLLVTTGACTMNCRFCFRQNFPYSTYSAPLENEIAYIEKDSSIHEVILSGGDPLSLSDRYLASLLDQISAISHIRLIRFHTRFPIGIPERISPAFLQILESCQKQIVFVIHTNHPHELDREVLASLKKIQKSGVSLLSQTVLLSKVNDNIETLKELFLLLSENGVIPYYLHQLDPVAGGMHYNVKETDGLNLIESLQKEIPGYALPTYVKEVPFAPSKLPVKNLILTS